MIDDSDLQWDGEVLATPQLATPATAEAPVIEETPFNPAFLKSVDELELSVRSASCLKNAEIYYIGELVQKTEGAMLRNTALVHYICNALMQTEAIMARVQVVNRTDLGDASEYHVELQWCRYLYDDGKMEHGYRFIWVTPDGKLLPQRGQARLPSLKMATELMKKAKAEGWGDYNSEKIDAAA